MKRRLYCVLLSVLLLFLWGCGKQRQEPQILPDPVPLPVVTEEPTEPNTTESEVTEEAVAPETEPHQPEFTVPEITETEITEPAETEPAEPQETLPEHSSLYLENVPVEDVITWFNEVALDAEFSNGGDAALVQKWEVPIAFAVHGDYSEMDWATLARFTQWLNTLEGFPGISEAQSPENANLHIHFTDQQGLTDILGPDFWDNDGGVTFWYADNAIYDEVICIRTDLDQEIRNSVIMEEIYNGLGPVQDTALRTDSLIWQGFSVPQELTAVDELILKLLYHPHIQCGMDARQCEAIIRALYY